MPSTGRTPRHEQIGLTSGVNFDGLCELGNKTGVVYLYAEGPEPLLQLYGMSASSRA
jgi:hypothetical protein